MLHKKKHFDNIQLGFRFLIFDKGSREASHNDLSDLSLDLFSLAKCAESFFVVVIIVATVLNSRKIFLFPWRPLLFGIIVLEK